MTTYPPRWAETLLRLTLPARHRDTVSGDLLEEYREHVYPARGPVRANRWFLLQVAGFLWRSQRLWAGLFAAAGVARMAVDWLVPTSDFHTRSAVSTWLSIGLLVAVGFAAAWRARRLWAGFVAGVATTSMAAILHVIAAVCLVALKHDPATLAAIQASGGLSEAFSLPFLLVVPGAVVATLGGLGAGLLLRLWGFTSHGWC